jgi:DTW domain-containing protein
LILQHRRERFHPFNTARIVRLALANSQLMVQHSSELITTLSTHAFPPGTGLLYPGIHATPLESLAPIERPTQLVVLDGTWHHAKTLLRDIPQLQALPRYSFTAVTPSHYRIRREPSHACLSTLEATVAALQILEPETLGFESLLAAFHGMIDDQLASPMTDYGARRKNPGSANFLGIPKVIRDRTKTVVVVYGETMPGLRRNMTSSNDVALPSDGPSPCYWVAERLVSGERFESAIRPGAELASSFLRHLELGESIFSDAPELEQVANAWQTFLREDDVIAFYYSNIPKLLSKLGCTPLPLIHLKSIRMMNRQHKTLEQVLFDLGIQISCLGQVGRASKRLANTKALVQHLNERGNHL